MPADEAVAGLYLVGTLQVALPVVERVRCCRWVDAELQHIEAPLELADIAQGARRRIAVDRPVRGVGTDGIAEAVGIGFRQDQGDFAEAGSDKADSRKNRAPYRVWFQGIQV
ncbi:hypothetical protein D3C78_1238290 [compost metagenome]